MHDFPPETRRLNDTWYPRDLPVLVEIADRADKFQNVSPQAVATNIGLEQYDVEAAIQALVHAGYLHEDRSKMQRNGAGDIYLTLPGWLIPTGLGRREVGQWPSEQTALDRMIAQLTAIADNTAVDEDTRTRARRILDGFLSGGRDLGIAVVSAVITGQVT